MGNQWGPDDEFDKSMRSHRRFVWTFGIMLIILMAVGMILGYNVVMEIWGD